MTKFKFWFILFIMFFISFVHVVANLTLKEDSYGDLSADSIIKIILMVILFIGILVTSSHVKTLYSLKNVYVYEQRRRKDLD